MPHVTFIYPAIEKVCASERGRSRPMHPLAIAALSALTPPEWDRTFFDDRLEDIDFDLPTDLVAISVETFTARQSYQIAAEYRRRGVPVAMGGYHPTLCPDEATQHADAICIGEAEAVWPQMLKDQLQDRLERRYGPADAPLPAIRYDRSVFAGKRYFRIGLVEWGRGCPFHCAYCAVTAFHRGRCRARSVEDVVAEIRGLREKLIFIVDDNVVADFRQARELFEALAGSGKRWIGQATVSLGQDPELMDALAGSGCAALLLGFESFSPDALVSLDKPMNLNHDYELAVVELRKRGIAVHGTFMLGLQSDTPDTVGAATRFAVEQKLFLASFNHIVPFPGTPLYTQLEAEGRLTRPTWWLDESGRFADVPFEPWSASADQVREWCHEARRTVYGWPGLLRRGADLKANCRSPGNAVLFLFVNLLMHREFYGKKAFHMGVRTVRDGRGAETSVR